MITTGAFPRQPSRSEWPVTGSMPTAEIENRPLIVSGPTNLWRAAGMPGSPFGSQSQQGSLPPEAGQQPQPNQQPQPTPPGQGFMGQGTQPGSAFGAAPSCPPGPQPGTEQFRFAKFSAQQQVQQLMSQLQQPFPQAGTATVHRFSDAQDRGFMGDKPNRTKTRGQGAHPDVDIRVDRVRRLDVSAGTRVFAFTQQAFRGPVGQDPSTPPSLGTPYGPGTHMNVPPIKSIIVVPNVDFMSTIRQAMQTIKNLACPSSGCLINEGNYESHPAVMALVQYLDRVIALFSAHPQAAVQVGRDFEQYKSNLLTNLARAVIANRAACSGQQQPGNQPQGCDESKGERALTPQQVATFKQFGIELTKVRDLAGGQACYTRQQAAAPQPQPKQDDQCLAYWSGIPGNAPSRDSQGRPFCLKQPSLIGCQQRGGRLQAQILGSGAEDPKDMPVACLEPGGGMTRDGITQPGAQVQSFVPGQGYRQGGGGLQVQLRPVSSYGRFPGSVMGPQEVSGPGLAYGQPTLMMTQP